MRNIFCAIATIALACGSASAAEPIIDTIAGGGTPASGNGDGGQARQARLNDIRDVALDTAGNIYVAEACRIRKVDTDGIITTIGGNGATGASPAAGASALSGSVCSNTVAVDRFGNVWFYTNYRIGKIDAAGNVAWVAGTGTYGSSGDGGPATLARIPLVEDIALDAIGNAYFTDEDRVRKIATDGIVTTFAGGGVLGDAADGGLATLALLIPTDLFVDASGNVFIAEETGLGADGYVESVRKVDTAGIITRIFGGWPRFSIDPIAQYTRVYSPSGVVAASNGNVFVSSLGAFVALISPESALNATVVGTRISGFGGDGGPASQAQLSYSKAIAIDAQDNLYIADTANARIRKVTGAFQTPKLPVGAWMFKHATDQRVEHENQKTIGIVKGRSNADKLLDLFVLAGRFQEPGAYAIYAYRQQADGTMASPLVTSVPAVNLTDVLAIDLNHDPFTDIVFSATDSGGVFVLLGGPGGLSAPVRYTGIDTATNALSLDQADMNGDGHMDVLVQLRTPCCIQEINAWAVYYGNGTGALVRKKMTPVKPTGHGQVIRDFNGDSRPDLLMSVSESDSGLIVAYHDGIDSFRPTTMYLTGLRDKAGEFPVVGDFDNDGVLDIVTAIARNAPNAKLIEWTQTQNGFVFKREWATYDIPEAMIAADMNGDGRHDLLVKHAGGASIGYQQQIALGGGTFGLDRELKTYMSVGNLSQPHSIVIGDFNNDHCLDIAGSGSNSGLQIIYSTRCIRVKPGAKPPVMPTLQGTNPTATHAVASAPTSGTTNDSVWAASQKVARTAWTATIGSWSDTARWIGGTFALMLIGWWVLPASAFGRRRL